MQIVDQEYARDYHRNATVINHEIFPIWDEIEKDGQTYWSQTPKAANNSCGYLNQMVAEILVDEGEDIDEVRLAQEPEHDQAEKDHGRVLRMSDGNWDDSA